MRNKTRNRLLSGVALLLTAAFVGYAFTRPVKAPPQLASGSPSTSAQPNAASPGTSGSPLASKSPTPSAPAVNLRSPQKKYLGVSLDGVPRSLTPLDRFSSEVGKKPNMVGYFQQYGDSLDQNNIGKLYHAGALPMIQIEPMKQTTASIANGATDAYLAKFALDVKQLNLPVVLSFGHEMNGNWYPWGTQKSSATDFVRAWRRIHDIFVRAGATNVIWMWNVNVILSESSSKLAPLYPGDGYVDWVGVTGYFNVSAGGKRTFKTLFGPTFDQVRTFTKKPIMIAETGAGASTDKPNQIRELFTGIANRPDVLGFVWFNYHKSGQNEDDWRIDSDARSKAAFIEAVRNPAFGFAIA